MLAGCDKTPDEEQIRAHIKTMQSAIEGKQPGAFLSHVSENYQDAHGQDRRAVRRLLLVHFLRNQRIGVYLSGLEVQIINREADVQFSAGLTGGKNIIPERARIYRFTTRWRKENGDWRLISASWETI